MPERVKIKVVPNAKKSAVVGEYGDAVKIKIAAPALDGKANAELVKFLAKILDISKNSLRIVGGETSRDKLVEADCENLRQSILKSCADA